MRMSFSEMYAYAIPILITYSELFLTREALYAKTTYRGRFSIYNQGKASINVMCDPYILMPYTRLTSLTFSASPVF